MVLRKDELWFHNWGRISIVFCSFVPTLIEFPRIAYIFPSSIHLICTNNLAICKTLLFISTSGVSCRSYLQEPFKSLPLIWTIHEEALALRSQNYASDGLLDLLNDWKRVFNHSTVVVFPNYVMPVMVCLTTD